MRGRRVVAAGGPATRAYTTNQTTTLARLQGLVSAAEPGGGSLEFVFHHVCDPAEACGPDTVTRRRWAR